MISQLSFSKQNLRCGLKRLLQILIKSKNFLHKKLCNSHIIYLNIQCALANVMVKISGAMSIKFLLIFQKALYQFDYDLGIKQK